MDDEGYEEPSVKRDTTGEKSNQQQRDSTVGKSRNTLDLDCE